VTRKMPTLFAAVLLLSGARGLAAQEAQTSPSPTLPSDTLDANYAPRSLPGPMPELAPTLPSDTLEATAPVDSFSTPLDEAAPVTPEDSAALRELRSWIHRHPDWNAPPPPARAVLVRA
jgi:hypothetical protein